MELGSNMRGPSKGNAFAKGGCGCLLLFVVVGVLIAMMGGSFEIDGCGAVLLFGIGGVIGLVVLAIYNKGRRDGGLN